jgi:hypothetical protein
VKHRSLLKGAIEGAMELVDFATQHGIRLNDASPRNAGFDPVEGKWKAIDSGCYKIAGPG